MRALSLSHSRTLPRRKGIVLPAVLVVVVLLTLAAYEYSELMTAEYMSATSLERASQARALANSGIQYTAALLANPSNMTGNPYDNNQLFQDILVQPNDRPALQGRFSIVAPLGPDDTPGAQPYRFGVTDESGKINLNALLQIDSSGQTAYNMLTALPNMTPDIANSILVWIDPKDTPRTNGADNSYYQGLNPPYRCKNGPLDSLEELLLVSGVTPQLLFGNDINRNGILDPNEDDGTGIHDPGWSAYLTVYSRELNYSVATGQQRLYVNDSNLQTLYQNLQTAVGANLAYYIMAYRLYGAAPATSGGPPMRPAPPTRGGGQQTLNFQNAQGKPISSLYALIGSSVSIPSSTPGGQPTVIPSPLNDPSSQQQLLPLLLDQVSTVNSPVLPPRINVNTASQEVLTALQAALPQLTAANVQSILSQRPDPSSSDAPDPIYQTTAWLITNAQLSPATVQSLDKYITAHSQVYRVQSLGYFDKGGPTARIEAVIDVNNGRPRIIYWRDLTELGKGFDLSLSSTSSSNAGNAGNGATTNP